MGQFEEYFRELQSHKISDITEHSHRSALKTLLESLADPKIKILHEPKREGKFGSPDFKVTHTESIVGYVENKKIDEGLDKILKSEQIKKYQSLRDNILLTNYIEWIWLKDGKIQRETLCSLTDIENKRAVLDKIKVEAVTKLIKSFLSQAPKEIGDAKKLAEALAIRAKHLKDFLLDELKRQELKHTEGKLYQLYETFKSFIFHELTVSEFADAFAQNLVYGLFLAKLNADVKPINLYNAKKYIPTSFELIKELVDFLDELENEEYSETRWIVEEVLTIMNNLDLPAIQDSLSFTKKRKDTDGFTINDPYVYFYENFLAAYDKKLRKAKGVYYTPPPIVNFIVRAIDDILVNTFKIKEGLADRNKVTVLDFATGTGTFLIEVLQQIFDKLPKDSGKKDLIIKEHVLKNLFGFEYLIAPYTIAHLKLSQFLKDNGYELKAKERLQVYLTNTLEPIPSQIKIPLLPALTEESRQAQEVKDKPILVITGNPPYSYESKNPSQIFWYEDVITKKGSKKVKKSKPTWIGEKINAYKVVDGQKLKERNPKGLQDDYVKFIRFAQDKMDKVEEGIVGIITNHSFLDNPTFRGMRQSLMNTFDQIYFIDLHGNLKKKEKSPDGGRDENVFDIEQGVAISVFIKKKELEKKILHTSFSGSRIDKYNLCLSESINDIKWTIINPNSPFYYFNKNDGNENLKYKQALSLNEIFEKNSVGIVTSRDKFVIGYTNDEIRKRVTAFLNDNSSLAEIKRKYFKEKDKIDIDKVRKHLIKENWESQITQCNYRQFDTRWIILNNNLVDRARLKIMNHFVDKKNIGILFRRQYKHGEFTYVNIVDKITEARYMENAFSHVYVTPLYLYESVLNPKMKANSNTRIENFTKSFRKYINNLYSNHFSPEEILGYIFSILHSQTYREKYSEELKGDFPRIIFTEDKNLFKKLSELGNELIRVHLLKEDAEYTYGDFLGKGNNIVENTNFVYKNKIGKLYINKTQYFNNVPNDVFNFVIGGYNALVDFLESRKNRELNGDEVENVEKIIKVIAFTIDQIKKIDNLTKNWI